MKEIIMWLIKILKDWQNGDETHKAGTELEVDQKAAEALASQGICEIVKKPDEKIVTEKPRLTLEDFNASMEKAHKRLVDDISNGSLKKPDESDEGLEKTGGFANMSDYLYHNAKAECGEISEKFKKFLQVVKVSGMSEGVGPDGGYAVPTEFRNTLMMNTLEESEIAHRTMKIPMGTNAIQMPIINETSRASSLFGGITTAWGNEGVTIASSKPKLGNLKLDVNKLVAAVFMTEELIDDSPISMEPLINQLVPKALGFEIDEAIINGNGAGQPLGVMNAPSLITLTRDTTITVLIEDITDMWSRLLSSSMKHAVWLINHNVWPLLVRMGLEVGTTGGSAIGLIQYNTSGIAGAPFASIFGRPLIITEHCQSKGTTGDIILGDYNSYLLGQKNGGAIKSARSIHVKFLEDEVAFKFTTRLDGQPWMQSALTPKHGSSTLSSFVALSTK